MVRESKIQSFLKFSRLIRKYLKLIEVYFESRLTTAVSEELNNKIKVLKRMAFSPGTFIKFDTNEVPTATFVRDWQTCALFISDMKCWRSKYKGVLRIDLSGSYKNESNLALTPMDSISFDNER